MRFHWCLELKVWRQTIDPEDLFDVLTGLDAVSVSPKAPFQREHGLTKSTRRTLSFLRS